MEAERASAKQLLTVAQGELKATGVRLHETERALVVRERDVVRQQHPCENHLMCAVIDA